MKEMAWKGLSNGDLKVLELMDRELPSGSDLLPVRLKKDGGFTASSSVADDRQFELLAGHVQKKLLEYGERILKGDIRMLPYELGDEDACRFCSYHSVCGFDRKVDGCEKRRLRPMDRMEIWENLRQQAEREDEI